MPRRKTADAELLPPEDDQPKRGRKKLVDAEHTIKYSAPVPVEVEDDPAEIIEIGDFEEPEAKRRKTSKNERDDLRKKLAANNVTPGSDLKLSIERYLHSESGDGGVWSETEFCTKYSCAEAHITNEDYLDVARKWGVGKYRFTLRMNNKIVTAWDKRISAATTNGGAMASPDPMTPPVPYQMPAMNGAPPLTFNDYLKQMVQTKKLMDEISGTALQAPPPMSDELQFAAVLLKDPQHAKKIVKNLIGGEGGEQSLTVTIIENAPAIIESLTSGIQKIIADIANARGIQNGQAPMATQMPQTFRQNENQWPGSGTTEAIQTRPQVFPQDPASLQANQQHPNGNASSVQSATSPEDQILNHLFSFVIEQCAQNTTPELVAAGIDRFMDEQVQADYPLYFDKVWSQLEGFAGMDTEIVLAYVKTLPNGAAVASLPHAKEWTARLQELLKPEEMEAE